MSNIYGGLQYWINGQPVLPDLNLVELKYWLNGEPYTFIGGEIVTIVKIPKYGFINFTNSGAIA